jgi:Bacterial Ig domain
MRSSVLVLLGLAALAGCAKPPAPRSTAVVYAVDLQGKAAQCTVAAPAEPAAGGKAEAKIALRNDGGWCGIPVNRPGPQPFAAGLLTQRAAHGSVTIHTVGDVTRVDYAPDAGFSGTDSFDVRLLPDNAEMKVAVTVEPGATAAAAASPPPAPPAAQPASTTTRRHR